LLPSWAGGPEDSGATTWHPVINAESTIGEVSREFNVTFRALRFYEKRGLISPRHRGAVRVFGEADRARLALVLQGKKLGFTLEEIRQMLAVDPGGRPSPSFHVSREKCVEQIKLLERQKRDIETALSELRRSYSEPYISVFTEEKARDGQLSTKPSGFPSMFPS
jgi:DNA-binding transcriptional MerR regulator